MPKDAVDAVYFEKTYYLGPDKGGEKGYSLLAQAMATVDEVALAKYAARGKSYLVLIRSTGDHLFMQQLYHSDEVRDLGEVPLEIAAEHRSRGQARASAHRADHERAPSSPRSTKTRSASGSRS